jgi:hypothetical protein
MSEAQGLVRASIAVRAAGLIAAAGLALTLVTTALAALPAVPKGKHAEPPKLTQPMHVVIVTDGRPGCEPGCAQWISAQGQIFPDTPAQFRRVFKALGQKKLPIFISSSGGSVQAAFAIGREIRTRGLDVAVERTIFQKCEAAPAACDPRTLKDGDKGRPEAIAAYCVSACAFILAAGAERVVPVYGFVGVHEVIEFQTIKRVWRTYHVVRRIENGRLVEVSRQLISEKPLSTETVETNPNYAPVKAYFTEMGIDAATIMPLLIKTPHQDIYRMTPDERRLTRLVTRVATGDDLLPAAAPAKAPEGAEEKPQPAASQSALPPASVSAELLLFYPPGGDAIDIYIRLKSWDAPLRADRYSADIQFANGKKLTARSTGGGLTDPLYVALADAEFCALRRAGDLSVKIALNSTSGVAVTGLRRLVADFGKFNGVAEFAAKHCGK